ncbi:MAG: LolA family protein [Flavobacteriales bacterium]
MRIIFFLTLFLAGGFSLFAQDKDPKAKAVLDEVSKKIKGYTSYSVEFSTNLKKDKVDENYNGKAIIKGDKYIIETKDQKIISDGKTVWTILLKEKEVYENPIDDSGDDELLNPTKMFNLWEKDFKYKWIKEEAVGGVTLIEIHLFPTNPSKAKFHTVIVKINKATNEVSSVIVKGKEGDVLTYKLLKLVPNVPINDADFKFDKAKYPGYTIYKD